MLGLVAALASLAADLGARLALGFDRRFARPTRSRMRAMYDNPSCQLLLPGRLALGTADGPAALFVM